MTKELLEKYFNNCCTAQEVEEVFQWMKQQTFFIESKELGKIDWQQFILKENFVSNEKLDILLDKIHHKINIEENFLLQYQKKKFYNWTYKVAAVLLIPVFIFLFYTLSENKKLTNQIKTVSVDSLEVIAPIGSRTVVELSDGSVVNLNYGSRIKYPREFTADIREVSLLGEGYFDVEHNPDKPFVVKTGNLKLNVLGTEFNVKAYPEEQFISTTLVDGKVVIEEKTNDNFIEIETLAPGQHVEYHTENGKIISSIGPVDKYIAWKNGKLVFDNSPITEVVGELNRKFHVNIVVEDEIKDLTYTVTFIDDPLDLILDLMTETTPITYKRHPRNKLPDGSFTKQEIIISKK